MTYGCSYRFWLFIAMFRFWTPMLGTVRYMAVVYARVVYVCWPLVMALDCLFEMWRAVCGSSFCRFREPYLFMEDL